MLAWAQTVSQRRAVRTPLPAVKPSPKTQPQARSTFYEPRAAHNTQRLHMGKCECVRFWQMRIPGCSHSRANISRNHFSSLIFPSKFPSVAPAQGVRCLFDIQSVSSRLVEDSSLNRHSSEFNNSKRGLMCLVQLYGETYEVELSGVNFI